MPDAAKKTEEFTRMPRVVYFPMEIALYDKLEKVILPLWYDDRPAWITVMKGAISKNAAYFNSHRMMRRYATEAYLR
jgi:glucan phosphorylase